MTAPLTAPPNWSSSVFSSPNGPWGHVSAPGRHRQGHAAFPTHEFHACYDIFSRRLHCGGFDPSTWSVFLAILAPFHSAIWVPLMRLSRQFLFPFCRKRTRTAFIFQDIDTPSRHRSECLELSFPVHHSIRDFYIDTRSAKPLSPGHSTPYRFHFRAFGRSILPT
jgi:hypothetical protein